MAFIRRKIDWTAPVTPAGSGLTMEPGKNPYIADVSANTEPDSRGWNIRFTQGEDTGNVVDVTVTQPPVYKFTICYYDKNVTGGEQTAEHTSGATIILCADMEGRIRIGQGTVSEDGCCEIFADQKSGYVFACGAREWSEYGNDILVSAGTDASHSIAGGSYVNFPVDDFDGCETVRSASTSATYEGSISIWATSKTYRNNICGSGVTAGDQFSFYMLVGEGQEECQIVRITPEVGATTDINNFVWNYVITGVDETNDEQLNDYEVFVSPISDTGTTGSFKLLKPYKQALTVESNVPVGTVVRFYSGNTRTNLLGTSTMKPSNNDDVYAAISVVGCKDKVNSESFQAEIDYELKSTEAESSTTFHVDGTTAYFNNDGTVKGNTGESTVIISVTSTSSLTESSHEEWNNYSGGVGKINFDNDFKIVLKKSEETTEPTTGNCGFRYEVISAYTGSTPESENVEVAFVNNASKRITAITLPNSVETNESAMAYFSAITLVNGAVKNEPQSNYEFTFNENITKNTTTTLKRYTCTASISGASSSLVINIEGTGVYYIYVNNYLQIDSLYDLNGTDSLVNWYEYFTDSDGQRYGKGITDDAITKSENDKIYIFRSVELNQIRLSEDADKSLVIELKKGIADGADIPTVTVGNDSYSEILELWSIKARLYVDGNSEQNLLTYGNNTGIFHLNATPTSRNLIMDVTFIYAQRK